MDQCNAIKVKLNETIDNYLATKQERQALAPSYKETHTTYWGMVEEITGGSSASPDKQKELRASNPALKKAWDKYDAIGDTLLSLSRESNKLKEEIGDLAIKKRVCDLNGK